MALLEATGVTKHYGGVAALEAAHFNLRAGEVHVLIGANGSGKSTLCKIIAGAVVPDSGGVHLRGREVRFDGPSDAGRAGIGVFYQELSLIPQLTVAQNIFLGREQRGRSGLVNEAAMREAARELMAEFAEVGGEGFEPNRLVADLAPDQRQMTEILKVLSRKTDIILFDEATAALDRRQVQVFFDVIRRLREQGRAVVFISHRMDEIFEIGDRITVLRDGRSVAELTVAETGHEAVVAQMVGADAAAAMATRPATRPEADGPADRLLTVEDFRTGWLEGISLSVGRGEIVGLGGLHGQGQSMLLRGLFGAARGSGTVRGERGALAIGSPRRALRAGFAYISGDRGRDGILPVRSVFENLVSACLSRTMSPIVWPARLRERLERAVSQLRVKFPSYNAPVTSLSGGNQQKVVIARWLATSPRLLLLDDPTKGIDLQAKGDLYGILRELAGQGVGILFYSSDDAELLELADRVLVFNGGRVVAELTGRDLNRFELYKAAYGSVA